MLNVTHKPLALLGGDLVYAGLDRVDFQRHRFHRRHLQGRGQDGCRCRPHRPQDSLQLETADKIGFLALTSSVYDPDLTIKAGGGTVKLTGPLVLHGDAVALFSEDLGALEVKNTTGGDVELSILVGFDIAA
jgi:hypothetical protein